MDDAINGCRQLVINEAREIKFGIYKPIFHLSLMFTEIYLLILST